MTGLVGSGAGPHGSVLHYRLHTQPELFERLLQQLPTAGSGGPGLLGPLSALTTRERSDLTIALLSAWASAGAIVTLYQERNANEGFLDTATEERALRGLAGLLGYMPRPGVAATAWLSFFVDGGEGMPAETFVPQGTQVLSVPPPGTPAVTFETSADLVALVARNAVPAQQTRRQVLTAESLGVWLDGTETGIDEGTPLLLVWMFDWNGSAPPQEWRVLRAESVAPDDDAGRTFVSWGAPLGSVPAGEPRLFTLELTASLFGADAPQWRTQTYEVQAANTPPGRQPQDYTNWPGYDLRPGAPIDLDAVYSDILPGSWMLLQRPTALELVRAGAVPVVARTAFTMSGKVTSVVPSYRDGIPCGNVLVPGRELHTATLLADGRIVYIGGRDAAGNAIAATQIRSLDGSVTAGAALHDPRWQHTATLLADGSILVCGGVNERGVLASAEVLRFGESELGTFVTVGPMSVTRTAHRATLLPGSGTVLVTGGRGDAFGVYASTESYDPVRERFTNGASMNFARASHTAVAYSLVIDGQPQWRVLVAGGADGESVLTSAENYVVDSGTFVVTGSMATARELHTATLLAGNAIVVVGGVTLKVEATPSVEVYTPAADPGAGTFATVTPLRTARWGHTATLQATGDVVVAGGMNSHVLASVEIVGAAGALGSRPHELLVPRVNHTATLLRDGTISYAGGKDGSGVTGSVEEYDPDVDTFVPAGALPPGYTQQASVLLLDGRLLVSGGTTTTADTTTNAAWLLDPSSALFLPAAPMLQARREHTATLLVSGAVLFAGGTVPGNTPPPEQLAEVYCPDGGGTNIVGAPMFGPRSAHTATELPDGTVLIAGGKAPDTTTVYATAELYVPAEGGFAPTGAMNQARVKHTATLLPNGMVLLAGGYTSDLAGPLDTAELYDPASGTFTLVGSMPTAHAHHTATALPNGNVLIAGGLGVGNVPTADVTIFVVQSLAFVAFNPLLAARYNHVAGLLPDGRVLVAGGAGTTAALASAEQLPAGGTQFLAASPMLQPHSGPAGAYVPHLGFAVVRGIGAVTPASEIYVLPPPPLDDDARRTTIVLAVSTDHPFAREPILGPVGGSTIVLETGVSLPRGTIVMITGRARTAITREAVGMMMVADADAHLVYVPPFARFYADAESIEFSGVIGRVDAGHAVEVLTVEEWLPAAELSSIEASWLDEEGRTVVVLAPPLRHTYDRSGFAICANVVPSTEGATVAGEVLGTGNAAVGNQVFTLAEGPLTWVPAAGPKGVVSTLEIRVDSVLWTEVESLYNDAGPNDLAYQISSDRSARPLIVFGDGMQGSRLPNDAPVVATYRIGIGVQGNVAADTLTSMPSAPPAISAVTNALPAGGGADPDGVTATRERTPVYALATSRIYSLYDFLWFVLNFAGIAKAAVRELDGPVAHITIAGPGGATIPEDSVLYQELRRAIDAARDPAANYVLAGFELVLFSVAARLTVDPRREPGLVRESAAATLLAAFDFAAMDFGRGVAASEVIAVLQSVTGVIGVDLDALYRTGETPMLNPYLEARPATMRRAAEILVIDSARLLLEDAR